MYGITTKIHAHLNIYQIQQSISVLTVTACHHLPHIHRKLSTLLAPGLSGMTRRVSVEGTTRHLRKLLGVGLNLSYNLYKSSIINDKKSPSSSLRTYQQPGQQGFSMDTRNARRHSESVLSSELELDVSSSV